MNTLAKTKERDCSKTGSVAKEIDKVIIGTIGVVGVTIALWSIACIVSAYFHAGGIIPLALGWLGAVAGI